MIAEFIGHGIHEDDDESCGNYICSSIKNPAFTDITFFVAYLRKPGLLELRPFIEKAVLENRNLTFYIGINDFITSKEALELLLELKVSTYIYSTEIFIFHPKVYLFEGSKNRIITGSSNLTKTGLFYNIECSLLLDFGNEDKSGLKVLKQLKDYFSPLLNFSDSNLEFVTQEHIDKLFNDGLIPSEKFDGNDKDFNNTKKKKIPKIGELGNLEILENKPQKNYSKNELTIEDDYLAKWEYMFERMCIYKDNYKSCTVKKEYSDHTLYAWYIKQKLLYNHTVLKMPQEHISKLLSIGFYFGDAHKLNEEEIVKEWLELLKIAVHNNERIILTHSYVYKNKKLGTWLIGISQANKKEKKLDILKRINDIGFDYTKTSKSVTEVIKRLINDLNKAENPNKFDWRSRFFKHIDKKDKLSEENIYDIEFAWEYHFNEKPTWGKIQEGTIDRTDEWRNYRKSEGQWFPINLTNGEPMSLYNWVKRRKDNPRQMNKIRDKFTPEEIREIRQAGFPV